MPLEQLLGLPAAADIEAQLRLFEYQESGVSPTGSQSLQRAISSTCPSPWKPACSTHASKRFPVDIVPQEMERLVEQLLGRLLQEGEPDKAGRQLRESDQDVVLPLLQLLLEQLPNWIAEKKDEWPFRVGTVGGVRRIDIIETKAFGIRAKMFPKGYGRRAPHTYEDSFFSYAVHGTHQHMIYGRGSGTGRFAKWTRYRGHVFGPKPDEDGVSLEVLFQRTCRAGSLGFSKPTVLQGIEVGADDHVVSFLVRSKLNGLGRSDAYTDGTHAEWDQATLCEGDEKQKQMDLWLRTLSASV